MPNEETTKIILEFPASSVSIELGTTITFDNISGFLNSDRVTVDGDTLTEKLSAMDSEIDEKADSDDVYDKTYIDNELTGINNALANKMDKANPTGTGKIAVGHNVVASGGSSQAFGVSSTASGAVSHAEGISTTASGMFSHAEGQNTTASGAISHAEGNYTVANHKSQHVFGEYNIPDDSEKESDRRGNYVEIVGNGARSSERSNARTLDWQGNETLAGDLTYNGNKSITSEVQRLDSRIDALPEPMVFKGTLGVGGTIQTLPTASTSNEGYTYKVITAGTYAGTTAKVGDVFTSDGSTWVLIPSGDEDSDTWRAIKVEGVEKLGNGISSGAVDFRGSANIDVTFDNDGNKVEIATKNIYTQTEVNNLVAQAIVDILPTETKSGSVANFETDLELPYQLAKFGIVATQEAGTPTPSTPKAISGWSQAKAYQRGVNLWNENTEIGGLDDTTGLPTVDNNRLRSADYCPIKESETVYVKKGGSGNINLFFYDANKTFLSKTGWISGNTTRNMPSGAYYFKVVLATQYGTTYNNDISINYPSSDTEYHAYNPNSQDVIIALGDTYYGGYVTQDKAGHRQLVVTHGIKLFGDISFSRSNNGGAWQNYMFYAQITDKPNGGVLKCSNYEYVVQPTISLQNEKIISVSSSKYIYVRDDAYTTVQDFKTANANTQLVYPLAEPIVIDLPGGEPITALNGVNNVFCDSGDTEVTYKLSINKALSNLGGGNRSVNLAKSVEEEVKEEVKEEPKDEPETRQER